MKVQTALRVIRKANILIYLILSKKLKVKRIRKRIIIITWQMRWFNKSVATINATLWLLDIYIYIYIYRLETSSLLVWWGACIKFWLRC